MLDFTEVSNAALEQRVADYSMPARDAEALRAACKQLQATRKFCPRYHQLFDCFSLGRRCPKAGCEWTCWFDMFMLQAQGGEERSVQ